MPKSELTFGNFSTADTNGKMYKLQPINFPTPEKEVEVFEVKGRSGDLLIDYGSFSNVELTADIALESQTDTDSVVDLYDQLRSSVMKQIGYQRLEDSDYSDEYRIARATGCELKSSGVKNGRAELTFNAKPQRYLTSGEAAVVDIDRPSTWTSPITEGSGALIFNATMQQWIENHVSGASYKDYVLVDLSGVTDAVKIRLIYDSAYAGREILTGVCYGNDPRVDHTIGTGETLLTRREIPSGGVLDVSIRDAVQAADFVFFSADGLVNFVVLDADNVSRLQYYDKSGYIDPPAGIVAMSPLITIDTNGTAVEDPKAVMIGSTIIGLNSPATISDGELTVPLMSVTIDSETYNAYYTDPNGRVYNCNPYVTIKGSLDFPADDTLICRMRYSVAGLEVVPRWWTI